MIECITTTDFAYWVGLMGDSMTQISPTLWRMESQTQTVLWELLHGDWCWRVGE